MEGFTESAGPISADGRGTNKPQPPENARECRGFPEQSACNQSHTEIRKPATSSLRPNGDAKRAVARIMSGADDVRSKSSSQRSITHILPRKYRTNIIS